MKYDLKTLSRRIYELTQQSEKAAIQSQLLAIKARLLAIQALAYLPAHNN